MMEGKKLDERLLMDVLIAQEEFWAERVERMGKLIDNLNTKLTKLEKDD